MTLTLYLFRHGETNQNKLVDIISGRMDHLPLSERGILQADALGQRLKEEGIKLDEVYSSIAVRAYDTAKIACRHIDIPQERIVLSPDLVELSQGDWEGKIRSETYTEEVYAEMKRLGHKFKAPNGESQKNVEERMNTWVYYNLIKNRKEDFTAGVFTHGLSTKCLLGKILDIDRSLTYRMVIDNCSITQLKYNMSGNNRGWSFVKMNDNAHLQETGFITNIFK